MMTEKEKDLQICKELTEIATDVFNKYCGAVPAGVYTVADIIKKQGGKYGESFADRIEKDFMKAASSEGLDIMRVVCVESFRCEFCASDVFRILAQFEKLAGVATASRAKFVKEDAAKILARVSVDIPKNAVCVASHCAVDEMRPVMNGVLIDLSGAQAFSVASDSCTLAAVPVSGSLVSGELQSDGAGVVVPVSVFKKICGAGSVDLVVTDCKITAFDADGVALASADYIAGRFPRWRAVLPAVDARLLWDASEMKKEILNAAKIFGKSTLNDNCVVLDLLGDAVRVYSYFDENKTRYDNITPASCGDARGRVAFRSHVISKVCKDWDGRLYFNAQAGRAALFGLKCGGFVLALPFGGSDIERSFVCPTVGLNALEVAALPVPAKVTKKSNKAAKVESVAAPAYPCTSGERCDVYDGAPVRELLAVYNSSEAVAVDPALLPVACAVSESVSVATGVYYSEHEEGRRDFGAFASVRPFFARYCAASCLSRSLASILCDAERVGLRSHVIASSGLASVASAPDVAPAHSVVGSSRPSASGGDRFRMWWRSLCTAVVALLAWCGLSLSSVEPSEVAPVDAEAVAAVVTLPAVECVAVVPGVSLPDVVCTGSAIPLELPAVDCVAPAPARLAVSAVTAQDLSACSSGGLSSPVLASVAVPDVVPGLGSSPAVLASL